MTKHSPAFVTVAVLVLAAISVPGAAQSHHWDVNVGVGPMRGHTTYQIGGTVRMAEDVEELWFPISELEFPINVLQASADTSLMLGKNKRLVVSLGGTINATSDAGKMEDSDWTTSWNPNQLDIYSESDAELDMLMLNADILYRFLRTKLFSLGAGAGFLYQELNYECFDFVQWYPSSPWWGYDYGNGLGIIYDITYYVPYMQVRADMSLLKERLQIGVNVAVVPYLTAEDYDDHVLRDITSDGDYDGGGAMGSLEATFHFARHWFVEGRLEGRVFSADGTQKTYVNDEWSHDIDAEVTSGQGSFTLAVGASL